MNPVMMRRLATLVIVASVVGAVVLVTMLLKKGQAPVAEVPPVSVVVANTAIHAKEPISSYSGKFHVVTKPKDQVPEDAVQKLEELDGKYALSNIDAGALVKKSQVGAKEQLGTIASLLRPGYLAMTVP